MSIFLKRIMISMLVMLCTSDGWSQQTAVAMIKGIADISKEKPVKIKTTTKKVRINRKLTGEWLHAKPKSKLFWHDRMLIQKKTRVAVQLKRKDQRGKLYFLPNSLETQDEQAIYEIQENPRQLGRVDIYIAHGSLIVDWAYGKLSIIAHGIQCRLSGTKVMVTADSLKNEGFIFIREGTVTFPDFPDIVARPMDAFRLRPGQRPVKFIPAVLYAAKIQKFMNYNSKTIWSQITPLWQKPVFYIPAAVGAGVVTAAVIEAVTGDEKEEPDLARPPRPPQYP